MVIGGTILPNARARWRILKQTRHPLAEQIDVNQINSADNEAGGLY